MLAQFFDHAARHYLQASVQKRASVSDAKFARAFEEWRDAFPSLNIEEFYTLVDLRQRLKDRKLERCDVDDLQYLISKTLHQSIGPSSQHNHFINGAMANQPTGDLALITLNWDSLIDEAIEACGFAPDYGFGKPSIPGRRGIVSLYKLHGGINWVLCHSCLSPADFPAHLLWEGESSVCKVHGEKRLPFVVPPTSQKLDAGSFRNHLGPIWRSAGDALRKCQELVIVGYSFPLTDVQFKSFVLDCLSRNDVLRRVSVVTSPKHGSAKMAFEDNYDRIFSTQRDIVHFRYETFDTWVIRSCQTDPVPW